MDWNAFADLAQAFCDPSSLRTQAIAQIREKGIEPPSAELWKKAGLADLWIPVRLRGPLPVVDGAEVSLIRYPHWAVVLCRDDRPDEMLEVEELKERALYEAAREFFDSLPGRESMRATSQA